MSNELAAVLAAATLAAGSIYAGVKKAVFQCLCAAGAALFTVAFIVKDF